MTSTYVQPIAQHVEHPERLLLRAEDDRLHVWLGDDPDAVPEEIDPRTASWLLTGRWLCPLPAPGFWFHVADLPVVDAVGSRQ